MAGDIEAVRKSAARAALNPALWPETLCHVSRLIGGDMTVFEHYDKRTGVSEIGFTDRPDLIASGRDAYERHYSRVNPRARLAHVHPEAAVHDDDLIGDDRTLGRSEFYVDFLGPQGLRYFIGTRVAEDAERSVVLSLQRGADRGRFGDTERRLFTAVLPDLRNAVAMYLRMVHAPRGETLAAVLDRLADPIAILREDGRLIFANRAMAGVIAAGDVVRLHRHRLHGARRGIAGALARAIGRARTAGECAAAIASPHPRLILRVVPLEREAADEFTGGAGRLLCLLIDDPARPHWRVVEEAMALFGLTRREATVGSHLSAGLSVDEIAARLGVSRNTVRTHLATLRDKLGVRSALAVAAEMRRAAGPIL